MIVEIALCVVMAAVAVLVSSLVSLLMQLREPVAEVEVLFAQMNAALPLLVKEVRAASENLHAVVDQTRQGVEHAKVLLHAAATLGDTVHWFHKTMAGASRSLLINLTRRVAGFKAMMGVVKAYRYRGRKVISQ
jgi:uncharacterized protein YoxC